MGTVVGAWRLKYIILLFVFVFSVYTMNSFFYDVKPATDTVLNPQEVIEIATGYKNMNETTDKAPDINWLSDLGGFITFANVDNSYARILINLIVAISWFVIGYLIFTFIKEWVPFV